MNYRIFVIIGIIFGVIGLAGGLYVGNIVVHSAVQNTDFSQSTSGGGVALEPVEIGFIAIGILGYALLAHGLFNDPRKQVVSTTSRNYR